jgi:hypothetical protein
MDNAAATALVEQVKSLVEENYVFPDIAAKVSAVLAEGLRAERYPAGPPSLLAEAVTADLQSVNGDKHLRLKYHEEAQPAWTPDDDAEEIAALTRWAGQACGGVACAQRLPGNVGYLDLQPLLFPVALCGEVVAAAMTLLASTDALIIDLRQCLGGDPHMVAFLISYLWDHEAVELSGSRDRDGRITQARTLAYVPGRRFGKDKPAYVLTSGTTFSGGEHLAFDLKELGRATIVGERTGGGAHPREGWMIHPHLEVTIPKWAAVSPRTGGNWEGTGVSPDVETTAAQAHDTACQLALQAVADAGGPSADEARASLTE